MRGLGRGLDALISGTIEDTKEIREVEIGYIENRKSQPRKTFNEELLKELAESIKEHGVIQPVLVRAKGNGFEIIAGERRFRAAKLAGLDVIPVVVKEIDDIEADELSLIENLQREDLNVIEEAAAYKNMLDKYGYTQEKLSKRVGKSRTHIANTVRILNLPDEIKQMLEKGQLSAGHARSILGLKNTAEQIRAARDISQSRLSVRETEQKIRKQKQKKRQISQKKLEMLDLEERLEKRLGTRIEIVEKKQGGKIQVYYYGEEELERLIELLGL